MNKAMDSTVRLLRLHGPKNSHFREAISVFRPLQNMPHSSLSINAYGLPRQSQFNFKTQTSPYGRVPLPTRKAFSNFGCMRTNPSSNESVLSTSPAEFELELSRLLALIPQRIRRVLAGHPELQQLIEIVMDLGRKPLARFPSGDFCISEDPVTFQDLEQAIALVGDFADDNRAGIDRSLHRISAIRNRRGRVIGLTCRVGRAISGSADMIRDLVEYGGSLLLIGPPGVGKTTVIREIARMLADDYKKRVVIVDTSNEIAGDGDIPHAGIGGARRMQVPNVDMQHKVWNLLKDVYERSPQEVQEVLEKANKIVDDCNTSEKACQEIDGTTDECEETTVDCVVGSNEITEHTIDDCDQAIEVFLDDSIVSREDKFKSVCSTEDESVDINSILDLTIGSNLNSPQVNKDSAPKTKGIVIGYASQKEELI